MDQCVGGLPLFSATFGSTMLSAPVMAQSAGGAQVVGQVSAAVCTPPSSPTDAALKGMIVGFSQSENEQNPFRAAETNSVKAAAKDAGVARLLYTNANDDQAKQVADIESMITQGAQALIVAPSTRPGCSLLWLRLPPSTFPLSRSIVRRPARPVRTSSPTWLQLLCPRCPSR